MTTFTTGGSAVTFDTSGTAVSFAVTATTNDFITSQFVTPGAHASSHGAAGSDPITTLGAVAHSGQQTFAAGSAAAPSIAATGDTNTGLYFPAADSVAIVTGGTARAVVSSAGWLGLGIGTATPGGVLQVGATGATNVFFSSDTSYGIYEIQTSNDSAGLTRLARKARGGGTPSVVSSGDVISDQYFQAHDGTTYRNAALIRVKIDTTPGSSDMPGAIQFFTTPDGSTSVTERMKIAHDGTITGSGSLGAWTSYTPTLGGFTVGSGAITGAYVRIGKMCHFRASWTYGSGSAAATAFPTLTLPVTASATTNVRMNATFFDTSASAYYDATSRQSSTTVVTMGIPGASGIHTTCTTTTPFTWATDDQIILSGTYEIA